jgi:predicted RNA-binding Zn-ribbon protein involved in translation (DUF1610 family)
MAERARFWRTSRWRDALRPDSDLALAEGLAAGTGLLTGELARTVGTSRTDTAVRCVSCEVPAEVVVVDLIDEATTYRCPACGRRWTAPA